MSTKPTTLPEWSSDQSNMTAPSAGQKQTGWTVGQDGVSDYDNWKSYWAYKWCEWLSDGDLGDLTFDNIVVTGSTTYTGIVAVALTANNSALDPLSTGLTTDIRTIRITPDNDGWELSGLVGGVDGREIEIVNTSDTYYFNIIHEGSATAANRFTLPSTLISNSTTIRVYPGGVLRVCYDTVTDRWRVVNLSGCRMVRFMTIPATMAVLQNGSSAETYGTHGPDPGSGGYWDTDGYSTFDYPVSLPTGSIIDDYRVFVRKNSSGSFVLSSTLIFRDGTDNTTSITSAGYSNTADAPGFVPLYEESLNMPTTENYGIYISVSRNPSTGSADVLMHAYVKYWDLI